MARTSKKRARQLKHDKFRDTTMGVFDRVGHRMEGRGRMLLYALAGLVALAVLAGVYSRWSGQRTNEARAALGRAIEIAAAPVTPSPSPGSTLPSFPTERERAQKAHEEFQRVADKYGDPYGDIARFMAATQLLSVERPRGISELEKIGQSSNKEIATRARFALAQAREADAQYDAAANIYQELLKQNDPVIAADTLNLRLATVYEKQGKKTEASDILFRMVDAARKAKGADGKPAPQSDAVRQAADKLEGLDPQRYAQLPPDTPAGLPS